MPDLNLVDHALTVAMWVVIAACVLGTTICLQRLLRAAQHLADTPNTAPIDSTDDHHRTSKEN